MVEIRLGRGSLSTERSVVIGEPNCSPVGHWLRMRSSLVEEVETFAFGSLVETRPSDFGLSASQVETSSE